MTRATGLPGTARVQDALDWAVAQGVAPVDARMLLLHSVGQAVHQRAWLLTHDTDPLPENAQAVFVRLCQRRLDQEPVAYLLGERGFYGLVLAVDGRVLDPRPDTETLVDWALALLPRDGLARVLDLGTGSGAIALALQQQRPQAEVWALDASPDALAVARHNAQRLGLGVRFVQGNWLDAWEAACQETPVLPRRFEILVSNPPYIRDDDPHLPALRHEPRQALTSGPDGLDDIRRLVAQAPAHLQPGGWLLLEHGWDQAEAVAALLCQQGFAEVQHRRDLGGHWRCSGGQWPKN